jgi:Mrp family chromosome partitioning ATPase/capsular polysaccharide biosynthesis protein
MTIPDDRDRTRLLVDTIRGRWRLVVGVTVVVSLVATLGAAARHPKYTSTAQVLLNPVPGTSFDVEDKATRFTKLSTEAQVVRSDDVARLALLNLPNASAREATTRSLLGNVTATVKPNTQEIDITFRARTAVRARDGAAAFVNAYLSFRSTLAKRERAASISAIDANITQVTRRRASLEHDLARVAANGPQAVVLQDEITSASNALADDEAQRQALAHATSNPGSILSPATLPTKPSSRSPFLLIAVGVFLGLLLGLGAAVARERSHARIRQADLLPDDVPLLVAVPPPVSAEPVVITAADSAAAEAYRRLSTTLRSTLSPGAVVVVSPLSPQAKTTAPVAVNLAFAAARDGRAVTLILTTAAGTDVTTTALPRLGDLPGLSEALSEGGDPIALRVAVAPSLHVLAPGREPARSRELFASARMRTIVDALGSAADLIVVEAPPLSHPDGQAISIVADGVILTCLLGTSTQRQLLATLAQAHHVRADVLGVVAIAPGGVTTEATAATAPTSSAPPTGHPSGVRAAG